MWSHTNFAVQFQGVILLHILLLTHARIELTPNYCACNDFKRNITDSSTNMVENTTVLYFLTFLPYPQPNQTTSKRQPLCQNEGLSLLPAAQLAVDHINQDTTILEGRRIALINVDSGCNVVTRAFVSFVNLLEELKKKPLQNGRVAGIVGPGCSDSTLAISPLFSRPEISLLSVHIATTSLLQNRTQYRNSFGILGSSYSFTDSIFSLLRNRHSAWVQIQLAVLYDESRVSFYNSYQYFEEGLSTEVPLATIVYHSAIYNGSIPISELKKNTARVIVLFADTSTAHQVMCLAYNENATFPHRQWILVGHTLDDFIQDVELTNHHEKYTCSKEKMKEIALNGSLLINYKLVLAKTNNTSITMATTYEQFLSDYTERVECYNNHSEYNISTNIKATLLYDAVWSLALAINASDTESENDIPSYTPLKTRTNALQLTRLFESGIGDEGKAERVREKVQNLEFRGVSGDIKFNKTTGFTSRIININQVVNSREINIAFFSGGDNLTFLNVTGIHFIKTIVTYETILTPVFVLFMIITLVQLIAICTLHLLSLYHRKHPSIKASSPRLNQLIYLGCYIFVANILLFLLYKGLSLDNNQHIVGNMCHAQWVWLVPIGTTLIIGTLTARTWRLYRIFVHFKKPGPFLSEKWLWGFILVQLSIDVCFGTLWSILDPIRLILDEQYEKDGVVIQVTKCTQDHIEYWFPILSIYKLLQLVLLIVLAIVTRRIKSKHFTTLSLRVGSYLMCANYLIFLPAYFILWYVDVERHIDFTVYCMVFNSGILICLVCILLPPILPVFKKK